MVMVLILRLCSRQFLQSLEKEEKDAGNRMSQPQTKVGMNDSTKGYLRHYG